MVNFIDKFEHKKESLELIEETHHSSIIHHKTRNVSRKYRMNSTTTKPFSFTLKNSQNLHQTFISYHKHNEAHLFKNKIGVILKKSRVKKFLYKRNSM